jgi:hypothetical protein
VIEGEHSFLVVIQDRRNLRTTGSTARHGTTDPVSVLASRLSCLSMTRPKRVELSLLFGR